MDIALVEMIMDVAGINQSKIQLCEETYQQELPLEISKKYNINNQLYTIYRVPKCPDENIQTHLWTFYQSILYFLKKDYFMSSEETLLKEYENFLVKFKNEIEKMFYVTQQKIDFDLTSIHQKDFLNILSRYIEFKIIILNLKGIEQYPEENSKNKKIVFFEQNNVYYPVIDTRFQGYEFANEITCMETILPKQNVTVTETELRAMQKDKLISLAKDYGIEVTKQGKTKIIARTRIELISDILKQLSKK